jgi:hypothetical protein
MFEAILELVASNTLGGFLVIALSTIILALIILRPVIKFVVARTKTKRDDEIVAAVFGAIDEHKEEIEAVHAVAKRAKAARKCKK